jgi:hypothetical protein
VSTNNNQTEVEIPYGAAKNGWQTSGLNHYVQRDVVGTILSAQVRRQPFQFAPGIVPSELDFAGIRETVRCRVNAMKKM